MCPASNRAVSSKPNPRNSALPPAPLACGSSKASEPRPTNCWRQSMGWFTEGFDTADLQEAKALLAELAG
jgi:hypothetical protein